MLNSAVVDRLESHFSLRYPPYTPAAAEAVAISSGAIQAPATAPEGSA
jgi:hypothetical protein